MRSGGGGRLGTTEWTRFSRFPRLTGADAAATLLGVMDDEHGNVMPALQLAQVGVSNYPSVVMRRAYVWHAGPSCKTVGRL
jgi:hypothetical protein